MLTTKLRLAASALPSPDRNKQTSACRTGRLNGFTFGVHVTTSSPHEDAATSPVLFHTSVATNIAYGRPGATRDEIARAAKLANADEFIRRMPQGYDTVLGERGDTLSGGQRQRIAIARAIVRDAPILLLDEPSAALDPESEALIFKGLDRLMAGRTSITIAHRLATVRNADVIFVLKDGRISERGTHHQLLAANGLYARLYHMQFSGAGLPPSPAA